MNAGVVALSIAFLTYVLVSAEYPALNDEAGARKTLMWSAMLSVVVAAVGITNSFLMAVTERFREIGTLKCLGAREKFVLLLILIEAGLVGFAGAFTGAMIGVGVGYLWPMAAVGTDGARLAADVLVFPFLFGTSLGTFLAIGGAGLPAIHASRMAPAEAMRVEV